MYDLLFADYYFCDLIFTGLPGMPKLGEELFSTGFELVPGAGFTTALALRRLGLQVGWATDFGNDIFSAYVLEAARREGLDKRMFRVHPFSIQHVTVSLSYPHERAFVSYVDPFDSDSLVDLIERFSPRAVLLPYLQYGPEHARVVAAAHAVGAIVYMDCQSTQTTLATDGVQAALESVDIFAPNAAEAMQLTGENTPQAALARLAQLTPLVVVKRGAQGSIAQRGTELAQTAAIEVAAVDTTGAGDCFNAGFLHAYLDNEPLAVALRRGNICGGLSTTARGGTATPTHEQVAAYEGALLRDPFVQ